MGKVAYVPVDDKDTVTDGKLVLRYIIEGATLGGTFGVSIIS